MVFPEIVAGPERTPKLTDNPELAVAFTVKGGSPSALFGKGLNVIVWFALAAVKLWSTSGARLWLALPRCEARTTTAPAPVIVTVFPSTIADPEKILKLTGKPELAVASTVNGGSPYLLLLIGANVMV